jgi:2-keto-4-pentenoate hydratase/2-oxohepta-3-ene-1,7-dioic acid hydratase in catechol pathway
VKLVTFHHDGRSRIGLALEDAVVDLSAAAPELPTDMLAFLEAGEGAMDAARAALDSEATIALDDVRIEAPIARPPKFLAIGLNYADHIAESGLDTPAHPTLFNKQSTCVIGPGEPFHLPKASPVLDYEGELGIVIGRRCRHVSKEDAAQVIAGYTIVNDVSVRDWQLRIPTWTIGKSFDTHGPIGPYIVTSDEVGDPHALELRTWVNGELRQHSNTKELVFDCFTLVEHLSTSFTLEPGDVIATGTPSGVGIGFKPPKLLVAGDVVRIGIDKLGELENAVIDEPDDSAFID